MKRRFLFLLLFLSVLSFTIFFVKDSLYSTTEEIPVESNPRGIAVNQFTNVAVVVNTNSDSVSIINLETQSVISNIPVGNAPKGVAIDKGLNIAVISNSRDNSVSVIDLNTYQTIGTIPVGKKPKGIAVNQLTHTAFVANQKDSTLSVIDLLSLAVTGTINVNEKPEDLAIDPELSMAVVVNEKDNTVSIINLNTYEVTNTVKVGKGPKAIDINPETHLAAIANKNDKTITVLNLIIGRGGWETTTISAGKKPVDIAINPLDNTALVVCEKEKHLVQIDLNTNAIIGNYALNKKSRAVAVNNFTNVAGVIDDETDGLTLINLSNPAPEITAVLPASVQRGSLGETITITGNRFVTSSIAYLNGQPLTTTLIDNHNLQAIIPQEMLLNAGIFPVTVLTTQPGGGVSNTINLIVIDSLIPYISNIEPTEAMAGTQALTLSLSGAGFFSDTVVYVNGTERQSTFINNTKLQIELNSTELETGGYLEIKATNPVPGGGTSNTATFTIKNPVPAISSINPATIAANSADFTLTLTGSNFVKTSTISFNNQNYSTTFVNSTQLKATIPSSAIQTPGDYSVAANNPVPGGGSSNQLILQITEGPIIEPLPEGSFGKQYEDLIPADATKSYDPKRFAIITGLVKDKTGNSLSGVTISIHSHSEYGTAQTDSSGRFSIPVEGGGTITVVYQKSGFITAHRQVYVSWNNISNAETITMVSEDTAATTVNFDGNASTVATHKSTTVTDGFGTRSLTMVFTGDNKAYAKNTDGTEVMLSTITTRATEFETQESMPAKLPPNSAYTYCSELSVDGAKNVRFEKPVVFYVDNFLGFNVGEKVPVGYYDRDRGVWVPSDNGIVVKLLDTNGDGIVDALDSTGDGLPDDLNGNGSFDDEVSGLSDPSKYKPNSTYWRVAVNHFTPWDCNWPYGINGPPSDSIPPNPEGEPSLDDQQDKDDLMCTNSYCESRSRIFHEDIPIPGTDMTLHYASNRVKGYKSVITIPVSGSTVPATLKNIIVRLKVAGRQFETILPPLPNQKAEFIWDGLDYIEKPVKGMTSAVISMGFVYEAVYYSAIGGAIQAFAQIGVAPTNVVSREDIISWKHSNVFIYRGGENANIAEGWTLSNHHYLSPWDTDTIYKGDGSITKNNAKIITTVAGNGQLGYSGDDGFATQARLYGPYDVAVDSTGNVYIADTYNNRIRKIDVNGIITTVAGGGTSGLGDGGPAINASLGYPCGIAVDSTGNIYIADYNDARVRKVDTNGIITTVAGNGTYCWKCGIGGPAIEAGISPYKVAVDTAGNVYIADYSDASVKKVSTNGIITILTPEPGFYGPFYPSGVTTDNMGNIYFSWGVPDTISKIDASGNITTIAGNGNQGYNGDGIPAVDAMLSSPNGIAIDSVGNIYIAEYTNNRIRKVDTNGIIATVAGNGQYDSFNGDGGPATQANLGNPHGVAIDSKGDVYIADTGNNRIRKVAYPSAYTKYTVSGDIFFPEENGLGYIFDSTGLHKSTIDLSTGKTLLTFGYDANKQLVSITDQFNNQTTIQRDANGLPISITSPDSIVTTLTVNSNQLTKVTYSDNTSYSFTYTTDGLMTDEYDPKNNHFVHQYDANGRITNISDPESGSWTYLRTVDNAGNILTNILTGEGNLTTYKDYTDSTGAYTSTITDPTGAITTITRSSDGLTETEQLCGMKLDLKYDLDPEYKFKYIKESTKTSPLGLLRTITTTRTYTDTNSDNIPDLITNLISLNNKNWTFANNTLTGISTSTSPSGRIITTQYDIANLLTKQINIPGLNPAVYNYDVRGRLTGITVGTRTTTVAYDANGNIDYIVTPDNKTFDYTYDIMGRLESELRPDSTSISYDYDNNGNLTILTNPKIINNTFDYTANDQRKTWSTPLSGNYLYSYDKERKLKTIQFPSGKLITNTYTNGLLTAAATPEGTTSYTYGCSSLLTSAIRGTESIAYTYDGSLLKTSTRTGLLNQTISYAYNNDFKLSSITYAGASNTFAYDNDGLLTNTGAFVITRNTQNGLPMTVSDGVITNARIFSGYGEIDGYSYKIGAADVYTLNMTRDQSGRITQKIESIAGSTITWDYAYDNLGRLLEVKKNNAVVETYTYDANGNRLTDNSRSYSHSTEDHIITAGSDTYQFDVDGFLTQKTTSSGTAIYNYSSRGELLSATLSNGDVITYEHDPMGRRIAKKVNGNIVEKYLWQGLINLLAIYDNNDNLISRFTYADSRMPMSMTKSGTTYYLSYDQVGSLRAVTDVSGNIIKQIDYDSFGNIISDSNPTFAVPFGFAGGLHDRDTGLVRFSARDYDSAIGRWTAKDPIDFYGGDLNLMAYVENDPVNYVDPLGLFDITVGNRKWRYRPSDHHGVNPPEVHLDTVDSGPKKKLGAETGKVYDSKGKTVCGKISKKDLARVQSKLQKLGYLGMALTVYGVYESMTADEAQALEDLLNILESIPKDRGERMLKEIIENNPDKFQEVKP